MLKSYIKRVACPRPAAATILLRNPIVHSLLSNNQDRAPFNSIYCWFLFQFYVLEKKVKKQRERKNTQLRNELWRTWKKERLWSSVLLIGSWAEFGGFVFLLYQRESLEGGVSIIVCYPLRSLIELCFKKELKQFFLKTFMCVWRFRKFWLIFSPKERQTKKWPLIIFYLKQSLMLAIINYETFRFVCLS